MQTHAELALGVVLTVLLWSLAAYPLALLSLARLTKTPAPVHRSTKPSRIALISAVGDSEVAGTRTIENVLSVRWPSLPVDYIVVVDGDAGVAQRLRATFLGSPVSILCVPDRIGKSKCQEVGLAHTAADIVIFMDAGVTISVNAILAFLKDFDDPGVGCVSGVDIPLAHRGAIDGETLYVHAEMAIRNCESGLGAMIGVSGCLFAVRRELCFPWNGDLTSDFALPILARLRGLQVRLNRNAKCSYFTSPNPSIEHRRKVRTVVHGMLTVWELRRAINPLLHPFLAIQLITRKVVRWVAPFMYLVVLLATVLLSSTHRVYLLIAVAQVALPTIAGAARVFPSLRNNIVVRMAEYVVSVLLATMAAWIAVLRGQRMTIWTPTMREPEDALGEVPRGTPPNIS